MTKPLLFSDRFSCRHCKHYARHVAGHKTRYSACYKDGRENFEILEYVLGYCSNFEKR